MQPAKPRVLIYSREINDKNLTENQETDWNLIADTKVQENTFMALVSMSGELATLSVLLRLNRPTTPSPTNTPGETAPGSRLPSEEKPDLYCVLPNMNHVKCAAGCANLDDNLLVCGSLKFSFSTKNNSHFLCFKILPYFTACMCDLL